MKMGEKPIAKKEVKTAKPKKVETVNSPAFKMESVIEKPNRRYRKGSKYDGIIDAFLKEPTKISKLQLEGVKTNYLSSQLQKRVHARKLEKDIDVSVVNNEVYLEKITS